MGSFLSATSNALRVNKRTRVLFLFLKDDYYWIWRIRRSKYKNKAEKCSFVLYADQLRGRERSVL